MIAGFWDNLVLDTPDPVINTMFALQNPWSGKYYDTKGGLMHGPGGESYYAAIWANDQAEYINPSFLTWDMKSETVPHCARMNISPVS